MGDRNNTIKNSDKHSTHHEHHHHHARPAGFRLLLVILFNVVITAAEFAGGVLSGSLALISDAWHNLSDVASLVLGYAGEKVSARSGGRNYTFGLRRFEVFIALVNALALVVVGVFIVHEAIERFVNPQEINVWIMLPIAAVGLAGNAMSIFVLARNRKDSLNLRAAFIHLLYDTISSAGVIIAGLLIYLTDMIWIDLAISFMIVIMIFWSSWDIIARSFRIFFQGAPHDIAIEDVRGDILKVRGVASVHGLHIWSVSSSEVFLSCHVCYSHTDDIDDTDEVIRGINSMLEEQYSINHTTIQIENRPICDLDSRACCNRKQEAE